MRILFIVILGFTLVSCSKTETKTWKINDFSKSHSFKIETDEERSVNNLNIYLDGEFTDTIYLSLMKDDSIMSFTGSEMPSDRIFVDYYGGEFELFLAPSNAQGELEVRIEIPAEY